MNLKLRSGIGIFAIGVLVFIMIRCKKDEKSVSDSANEVQKTTSKIQQKTDSIKQDSIKKSLEAIKYTQFVFPKSNKDSAMTVFLEKYNDEQRYTILALNRLDNKNKWRADTLIIPEKIDSDFLKYAPFPKILDSLKNVKKIAFFSYKIHAYALYENGNLIKWGPTSLGRKTTPTKTGLKFTNWKKEIAISTSNSDWKLRWNFNVHNTLGIGWHQYDLPGFHASHSCMRLLEEDAKWMYNWANQWVLGNNGQTVLAKGTPVIIFDESDFKSKPWMKLVQNPKNNDYSITEMYAVFSPFLQEILKEQENSEKIRAEILQNQTVANSK